MAKPTMKRIMLKNPFFFKTSDKDMEKFLDDKERIIVREGDNWLLKVHTSHDTTPVYRIEPDLTLSYLRGEW